MNLNISPYAFNAYSNILRVPKKLAFGAYTQSPVQNTDIDYKNIDLTNPNLAKAWHELDDVKFSQDDIRHVEQMGAVMPFKSGHDAIEFMKANNIRLCFAPLDSPHIHAQYDDSHKLVEINALYKDSTSLADITAISGAIMHEMGHAKDKDGVSSVQEEMDCLAMNALADRAFVRKYGALNSDSLIVKDGTREYAKLFFDSDPRHQALIERLKVKYGSLSAGGAKHPPSRIALAVKSNST